MGYYVYCFEEECYQKKPAEAYENVITQMLTDHPELIGKFESCFTTNKEQAETYTGNIKYVDIAGRQVAIPMDFGTADKRKNLELIEATLYGDIQQQEENAEDSEAEPEEAFADEDDEELIDEDEYAFEDEEDGKEEEELIEAEYEYENEDELIEEDDEYEDEEELIEENYEYEEEEAEEEEAEDEAEEDLIEEDEEEYEIEDEDDAESAEGWEEELVADGAGDYEGGVKDENVSHSEHVQIWKKHLPELKELVYERLDNRVRVSSEEYKYKGAQRLRFVVEKDRAVLFSFVPEFEMKEVYQAWIYLDRIWMIAGPGYYGGECFLCTIKVNGRKVEKLITDISGAYGYDAYVRKDREVELLFVEESVGDFLWYNLQKKECRYLNTGVDCEKKGYSFSGEENKQDPYQGYRIFEDGYLLLNQEFLFGGNGGKEEIRDYLNCEEILSASRKSYYEQNFIDEIRVPGDAGQTTVTSVRYVPEKGVTIQIGEVYPPTVEISPDGQTVHYNGREVSLGIQEEKTVQKLLEEEADLKHLLHGLSKDFLTGYVAGETSEIKAAYLYGERLSELLLACTCGSHKYLGIYNRTYKMLTLFRIKWKHNEAEMRKLYFDFKAGNGYQAPKAEYFVTLQAIRGRYAIDESNFNVLWLVRKGLSEFFQDKIRFDAEKEAEKGIYEDNTEIREAVDIQNFQNRIISCAGLLANKKIFWTYPAYVEGKALQPNEIYGAILIMDLKCLGYPEPMVVHYNINRPNRIMICENKPFGSDRDTWWDSVHNDWTIVEIPGRVSPKDAGAIIPSSNPPEGVSFTGVNKGFFLNQISVTTRLDDHYYSNDEIDPMNKIYQKQNLKVFFDNAQLRGSEMHPRYQNLRAGQFCEEGFLYATQKGAFFMLKSGMTCCLVEGENICGLEYLSEKREIKIFRFKGLKQYEFHEHYDIIGGMSEEWRNSYNVELNTESISLDEVLRFMSSVKDNS
ncbi:MAG: hypothetical protein IKO10_01860 [Lachnospiraceae bacterium]|nr:hypothetical protein [Lachnospiraceae bacterium]